MCACDHKVLIGYHSNPVLENVIGFPAIWDQFRDIPKRWQCQICSLSSLSFVTLTIISINGNANMRDIRKEKLYMNEANDRSTCKM